MEKEIRRGLSRTLVFGGLTLAVVLGLLGTLTRCSMQRISRRADLFVLDRRAKVHFDQARARIPETVKQLTSTGSLLKLCWKMAADKVRGGSRASSWIMQKSEGVLRPCNAGARIYGLTLDNSKFLRCLQEIAKVHGTASAFSLGSLGIEAFFLKSTLQSLIRLVSACAARIGASLAGAGAAAAADGPLPVGDAIGVLLAAGGTVWTIYDLRRGQLQLREDMTAAMHEFINSCQSACRKAYLQ